MAARKKTRAREAELGFEAISIEGGVLSPEWLSRVAQLSAGAQADSDYRIPRGLNLRDEIGRYWRIAHAHWQEFAAGHASRSEPKGIADRFVTSLLRDSFGFASLTQVSRLTVADRSYPIGNMALGGRVPVVVAHADVGLDTLSPAFGDGTRRRSAFGLAQEYLNAQDGALWGLTSDGATLRILRDNASLTRPAWLEVDLRRIFTEERYADFAALWLLVHETRFGLEGQPVTECALETWRSAGREEGTRAREHLRRGVEEALVALGGGFLSHPENQTLRADLQSGALSTKEYFNQLLRVVYRLIFLLTVEERNLLHPDGASDAAKALYAHGYSLKQLRRRAVRRSAHDRFWDLWESTKVVFGGLAVGEPRLGLPALAGIFEKSQCPALDTAKLENRAFLLAVFKLAWLRQDGSLARVNWRDMGPEELGSVYESLLELVPQIEDGARSFRLSVGNEEGGHARRSTGSYYTPEKLVRLLLDRALEPVIASTLAASPHHPAEALLELSILDPACGSGHFLLAASRRLAAVIAQHRAQGTPSASEYRHAVRQVVGGCLFGVDLNPLAVELCRVSLWMEALEPGRPLSFLDSHVQLGNSLFGATRELLEKGIPDAAWEPVDGEDARVAKALKTQNAREHNELALDLGSKPESTFARIGAHASAVDAAADESLSEVAAKEEQWLALVRSAAYGNAQLVADLLCAAFVWPQAGGPLRDLAPTEGRFRAVQSDGTRASLELRAQVGRLRAQHSFFHWHLAFPQVFGRGGFDVILGNPPWIAHAGRAAQPLQRGFKKFCKATYRAFAGYPTTHGMFIELAARLLRPSGAIGLIVPSSVSELPKYEPTRRAHDVLCDFPDALTDFGEGQFPGVTQPCMALVSRGRDGGRQGEDLGAGWPMERPDLNEIARALLEDMAGLPALSRELFGERGFQSDSETDDALVEAAEPQDPHVIALREGKDVREFQLLRPRIYADPVALAGRIRSRDEYEEVKFVVRNTARFPIAALSDGQGFRNSLLAGFESATWPAAAIVAFLNSSLIRWQHYVRFRDARQPIMPQVKIGHLRSVPQPPDQSVVATLKIIGERLSAKNAPPTADERSELDELVFAAFSATDDARALVTAWHRSISEPSARRGRRRSNA
jgi:hypothetical protein